MLFGYFWLLRRKLILGSKLWLVGGSFIFYAYWNIVYVPLLLESIFVNFFIGSALGGELPSKIPKRVVLILGILFNLCLLAYFKYTDFFIENFNGLFDPDIPLTYIVLPLGISFFTFTQIAFLVDSYKGEVKEYDVLNYMLFVSYFPHLLAGPILHHAQMIPQFTNRWNWAIRWRNIATGLFLFSIGLFKKVVIADTFSEFVHQGFDIVDKLNFVEAWMTSLSYTFQIYFDFSGYSDMAIGLCKIMGIRLPENFNNPYLSSSITEFWRRWHITLGSWMKNYLYIPLGGNKVDSNFKLYRNLFIVFLLSGLWHGASWNFIIWGAFHGLFLVLERLFLLKVYDKTGKIISTLITFLIVVVGWVYFRLENLEQANHVVKTMFSFNFTDGKFALHNDFYFSLSLAVFFSFFAFIPFTKNIQAKVYGENHTTVSNVIMVSVSILLFYISLSYIAALDFNPFIYFRF